MTKHLVVVAGNIGAGKTSLAERIGARLGWRTGYESVADNPYLADFYADMRAWAFHLQVFFLAQLANVAKSAFVREKLLQAQTPEELVDIIEAADPAVTG